MECWQIETRQRMPLWMKIKYTQRRIKLWHEYFDGDVYISFSGGKDSTVLLDIARKLYPDIHAMFLDTGMEFPEIRDFVKTTKNVTWVKPKMKFKDVIEKYGYPVISKEQASFIYDVRNTKSKKLYNLRMFGNGKSNIGKLSNKWKFLVDAPFKISGECCNALKKKPAKDYEKLTGLHPILALMASESNARKGHFMRYECNMYDVKRPISNPMMHWTDTDVWEYIEKYNIKYSEIYNKGYSRTGCMFCMFGIGKKDWNNFARMEKTHPKQYKYMMNNLKIKEVTDFIYEETGHYKGGIEQRDLFD